MTKDGVTYYYHVNSHGDVTSLTDANGNVVAEYEYDAWDNILSQSGTMASVNPYRYAEYMYDEETGLYYLMARYYDAEIGRFISRDTFAGFSGNPQSLNLYAYSYNNPVNLIDPSGNIPSKGAGFKDYPRLKPQTSFEKFVYMSARIYLEYEEAKYTMKPYTNALKKTLREANNEKTAFDLMTVGAAAKVTDSAWELNFGVMKRMGGKQYVRIFRGGGVVMILWKAYDLGKGLAELTRDFKRNLDYELEK